MASPYLDRPLRSLDEIAADLRAALAQAAPGSAEHARLASSLAFLDAELRIRKQREVS